MLLATTFSAKGIKRCKALALPFKFKALIILICNRLALGLEVCCYWNGGCFGLGGGVGRAPGALFNVLLSCATLILRPTALVDLRRGVSDQSVLLMDPQGEQSVLAS